MRFSHTRQWPRVSRSYFPRCRPDRVPLPRNPGGEGGIQKLLPEICEFAEVASYGEESAECPGDNNANKADAKIEGHHRKHFARKNADTAEWPISHRSRSSHPS